MTPITAAAEHRRVRRTKRTQPSLCTLAIDHRSASLALRERVALTSDGLKTLIHALRHSPGCQEAFAVSTCLRTEITVVSTADPLRVLAGVTGVCPAELVGTLRRWDSPQAVAERLFRVAAGLESIALGETQVLGQLKDALRTAEASQSLGPVLHQLVERALGVGRRVRRQTALGSGIVSLPSLAAHIGRETLGDLRGKRVVILGTGKMAELSLQHLRKAGAEITVVSGHGVARARTLTDRLGGTPVSFSPGLTFLDDAAMVVCATRPTTPLLDAISVAPWVKGRSTPLLIVDLCVPRCAHPDLEDTPGVRLVNLDTMRQRCEHHRRRREAACVQAEVIVEEAVAQFQEWLHSREVVSIIQAVRQSVSEPDAAPAAGSHSRARRVAHEVIRQVRRAACEGQAPHATAIVRQRLGLELA